MVLDTCACLNPLRPLAAYIEVECAAADPALLVGRQGRARNKLIMFCLSYLYCGICLDAISELYGCSVRWTSGVSGASFSPKKNQSQSFVYVLLRSRSHPQSISHYLIPVTILRNLQTPHHTTSRSRGVKALSITTVQDAEARACRYPCRGSGGLDRVAFSSGV